MDLLAQLLVHYCRTDRTQDSSAESTLNSSGLRLTLKLSGLMKFLPPWNGKIIVPLNPGY